MVKRSNGNPEDNQEKMVAANKKEILPTVNTEGGENSQVTLLIRAYMPYILALYGKSSELKVELQALPEK